MHELTGRDGELVMGDSNVRLDSENNILLLSYAPRPNTVCMTWRDAPVKIQRIETLSVGAPAPGNGLLTGRNYLFVRVHTDDGLVGLGESTLEGHDNAVRGAIADLEPLLIGEDPTRVGYLTQVMMRQKFWQGGDIKGSAVAGIELALWDILGKSLDASVHEIVGGAVRDKIRYYVNGWSGGSLDTAEIAAEASAAYEQGHRAFKFSLARPSWPVQDHALLTLLDKSLQAIRDAVGHECPIMFDGHGRYDSDQAIAIARVLAAYGCFFFEEPVGPSRARETARVAARSSLPIAAGERLFRKEEFAESLLLGAFSIAQPDLAHCHGFSEGLKIAALADSFGASLAPHGPMSPLLTTISMHLDAVAPNFLIQECVLVNPRHGALISPAPQMADGYLQLPAGPGWGVELNEELCREHPPFQVTVPRLFKDDGSVADW